VHSHAQTLQSRVPNYLTTSYYLLAEAHSEQQRAADKALQEQQQQQQQQLEATDARLAARSEVLESAAAAASSATRPDFGGGESGRGSRELKGACVSKKTNECIITYSTIHQLQKRMKPALTLLAHTGTALLFRRTHKLWATPCCQRKAVASCLGDCSTFLELRALQP